MTRPAGFAPIAQATLVRVMAALRERNLPMNVDQVFTILWKTLLANDRFCASLEESEVPTFKNLQLSRKERLLLAVIDVMQANELLIAPRLMLGPRSAELLRSVAESPAPSHFFMLHSGFAYMVQAFAALGRRCAVISSWSSLDLTLARSRLSSKDVEVIPNDLGCLLRIHKAVNQGLISTNCIDFSDDTLCFRHVSPILPDFALRCGHAMHFARAGVNDDGTVGLQLMRHEGSDAIEATKAFIRFSNGIPDQQRMLSVGVMKRLPAEVTDPG